MTDFYKAFEDRFRGSRELVTERLKVYLPLIGPLKKLYPKTKAIDLGCGRGEWLELLQTNNFECYGVDTDEDMLGSAEKIGLTIQRKDALELLKSLPNNSVSMVTGFHLAEHLEFVVLQQLVKESLRVLMPAGLLILETPNPENIGVGSNSFYLDPTHIRPLPPTLLSFLPEYYGFVRVTVFRLNSSIDVDSDISLLNVINGTSPDYSIVAQKNSEPDILKLFDAEFYKKHGVAVDELALKYEKANQTRHELENQFHMQIEREQSLNQQLQTIQQQLHFVEQEQVQREHVLSEQALQIQRELKDVLFTLAQREQEFASQLQVCRNQIEEQRTALEDKHSVQAQSQRGEHEERERDLKLQLQGAQQELRNVGREWKGREQLLSEQTNNVRNELTALLRTLAQREHEFAAQLQVYREQLEQQRTALEDKHSEQAQTQRREHEERERELKRQLQGAQQELRSLGREWKGREQLLSEQTNNVRNELTALLRTLAQREQEFSEQLQMIRDQALEQHADLEDKHREHVKTQRREHEECERELDRQLQVTRQQVEQGCKENSHLQSQIQALHQEKNAQEQYHRLELEVKKDERNRLMQIAAAVEGKIKTQAESRQQNGLLFQQTLSDVQQAMDKISLARRMMRSLVKSISLLMAKVQTTKVGKAADVVTLEALLLFHDRQFVQQAYLAVLGRPADPEGLNYYTELLRSGNSKLLILAGLRLSAEGKTHTANIFGLDSAIQVYQWSKIALLGKLLQWACTDDHSASERALRALENKLYRLSEGERVGHNQIESVLNDLQNLRPQLTVAATQSESSKAQIETITMQPEAAVVPLALPPEPEVPMHLPHQASLIYLQLRKSKSTASRNLALAKESSDVRSQTQVHAVSQLSPHARNVYIQLKEAAFIHARRSA